MLSIRLFVWLSGCPSGSVRVVCLFACVFVLFVVCCSLFVGVVVMVALLLVLPLSVFVIVLVVVFVLLRWRRPDALSYCCCRRCCCWIAVVDLLLAVFLRVLPLRSRLAL